jgi:hypothetical protein
MIKDLIKNNLNYLLILAVFIILGAVYFMPAIQGYSLIQGDTSTWKAVAKEMQDFRAFYGEETAWTNSIFGGMPGFIVDMQYLNGFFYVNKILSLSLPFPVDVMFIAMLSFLILAKSLRIETLIGVLGAVAYAFMSYHMHILEAGHNTKMRALAYMPAVLGAFIMIYKNKKILFPAALFAFFMALELIAGHIQMTYYLAFILIAIGIYEFIRHIKDGRIMPFFVRTGVIVVAIVLSLLSNFTNSYYTNSYGKETMRAAPELTINPDGTDKVATQSTGLDRDYIVQWCYGKEETLNLLIPNVKGDSRNLTGDYFDYLRKENPALYNFSVEQYQGSNGKLFGGYWGDQPFTSGANYLGAIIIMFAIMYLVFVKSGLRWPLLGVTVLTIMLSWGKNLGGSIEDMWLTNFFIDYVPLYDKFRTVSSMLIVLNLLFPLMAILFVNHVYKNQDWAKQNAKKLMIAGGSVAGFVLILAMVPSLLDFTSNIEDNALDQMYAAYNANPSSVDPADVEEVLTDFRIDSFRSDAYRTLMFLLIGLALLFLWITKKIKYNVAIIGLTAVVLIDTWMVDKRYLKNEKNPQNKRNYLSWEKRTGFENTPNATQGDFDIYNREVAKKPNIEQEYQQRKNEAVKKDRKNAKKIEESIRFATLNFNTNYRVMNLDNPFNSASVGYFHKSTGGYHAAKMARYQDLIDFYISKEVNMLQTPEQTKVLNMLNNKYYLYQGNLVFDNPYALGNAWLVGDLRMVANANEEIMALGEIDPKNTAVVNNEYSQLVANISKDVSGSSILMEDYKPNHLIYNAEIKSEVLAVFSELHYKDDWVAYIDGKEVDHLRANYMLRALPVPKGKHKIEFKFEPKMLVIGDTISIISFALIFIALVYGGYTLYKEQNESAEVKEA